MTADVSPDDPRPPTSIRDSGGSMPFSEADFTRDAARLVAEGDRVPAQRGDTGAVAAIGQNRITLDRANLKRLAESMAATPDDWASLIPEEIAPSVRLGWKMAVDTLAAMAAEMPELYGDRGYLDPESVAAKAWTEGYDEGLWDGESGVERAANPYRKRA